MIDPKLLWQARLRAALYGAQACVALERPSVIGMTDRMACCMQRLGSGSRALFRAVSVRKFPVFWSFYVCHLGLVMRAIINPSL